MCRRRQKNMLRECSRPRVAPWRLSAGLETSDCLELLPNSLAGRTVDCLASSLGKPPELRVHSLPLADANTCEQIIEKRQF